MDDDLRNGLWNVVYGYVLEEMRSQSYAIASTSFYNFAHRLWHFFLKKKINEMPTDTVDLMSDIEELFFS